MKTQKDIEEKIVEEEKRIQILYEMDNEYDKNSNDPVYRLYMMEIAFSNKNIETLLWSLN